MLSIENIAQIVHNVNKSYCEAIGDESQVIWDDAPDWQKESAINGVKALIENPDLSPKDMHSLWWEIKKLDGWRYGPIKDANLKEHPCCLPFDQLPSEQRAKDHLFSATVLQLLKTQKESEPPTLPNHHRMQSQQQLDYINAAKMHETDARHFVEICEKIFATDDNPEAARNCALARTHLEDAFMRIIRTIANPLDRPPT